MRHLYNTTNNVYVKAISSTLNRNTKIRSTIGTFKYPPTLTKLVFSREKRQRYGSNSQRGVRTEAQRGQDTTKREGYRGIKKVCKSSKRV